MLELVLGTVLDAAVVIKADGFVGDWNAAAEAMFGWSKAEASGRVKRLQLRRLAA